MFADWLEPDCESDPPAPSPVTCPYEAQDPIFPTQSPHFCTITVNHTGDHECLCGYTWAAARTTQ